MQQGDQTVISLRPGGGRGGGAGGSRFLAPQFDSSYSSGTTTASSASPVFCDLLLLRPHGGAPPPFSIKGQLQEAMDVINGMPLKPDRVVWGALLGGCRVHNNIELAQVAAKALISLEPESSAPYVLLYNMYADMGQWDDDE